VLAARRTGRLGRLAAELAGTGTRVVRHSILGRFGEQRELDSAPLFFASPASSYVTGTTLTVDGGFTAL
jgi:NAD(P)-dependent dehydrogenase (short-subunit alcohol dehydrogenase family)